jgi:hypothetical protein
MTDRQRHDLDDIDIDPDEALAAEPPEDRNLDPGADLADAGVPADDRMARGSEVPDPEVPVAPTDEPVGSTAYGTTEREQAAGEPLEVKLDREEPDESAGPRP